MWKIILSDLQSIIQRIEADLTGALNFLKSFIEEAFSEEEAALFPAIEAQVSQLLQDEAKTQGLTVAERVQMAVTELTFDAGVDLALATSTLKNAYVWTVAHKLNLTDGNQGQSSTGDLSGNATTTP